MVEKLDYPLCLLVHERGNELYINLKYDGTYLAREIAEAHLKALEHILEQVISAPGMPHSGISLLSADRYEKIVREWNRTDREYPTGTTVHQLFSEQAERTPDAVALVYGEARMSYRELNERSNSLARHIRQVFMDRTGHEMQPDTMVPLCLERSLEMVVGILGVLKAGAAYVPMDPGYPKERLLHILKDTGAELVLSQTRMEERENLSPIEEIGLNIDLSEPFYQKYQGKELQPNSGPEDLAYVIYTSGTTGKPKGVMVQHGGIVNMVYIQEHRLKINEGSKIVQYASYVFDASVWEIFGSLSIGAELSIIPDSIRQDAALLSEHIEKHGINTALFPPILLMEMSFVKLKALKTLLVGGDASSLKLMDTWHVGRMLVNAYGPTEGTVCASMYRYGKGDLNTKIGKPLSNTRAYVLDPYGSPVPIGVPGELYIGGAGLARGYLNQPGLTAERFVANTFATEKDMAKGYDRLYRTGDMVRWLADGNLEFLGRNDHQVKIRGYRIELGEVEHAISRIEGIKQACVLALERETGSGTVKYLVGYYVLEENFAMEQTVLSERLSGILPEYMVPSALVNMESFPLTVNGKLDRRALPSPELGSSGNDYVPPSTDLQEQLCHIWEEVLGLERVGITDDFFRIGGNSILAIRVSHQIGRALHKEVNVADIFRYRTPSRLLAHGLNMEQVDIPRTATKRSTLSFAQERLWFIERYEGGTNAYHMPFVLELQKGTRMDGIVYALRSIVARHEILRSTIEEGDGHGGVQVVHEHALPIEEVSIADESGLDDLLKSDIDHPFDLEKTYPIKIKFYHIEPLGNGSARTVLLLNIHHIAFDGWSMGIFQKELYDYYEAYIDNDLSFDLPELDIQYRDYALWQRSYLTGDLLDGQLAYWKGKLSGHGALELPTDHPRPSEVDYRGAQRTFSISADTSNALRTFAKDNGTTLHSVLLAATSILLGKYTGQDDIVIGSPVANRQHRQTEGLIGFFVNIQVNRARLSASQNYLDLVLELHNDQISAQRYQDLPFERLVDELGLERDLSRHPVFQVSFAVQGFGTGNGNSILRKEYLKRFDGNTGYDVEKFDLSILMDDNQKGEIKGQMSYATSLFEGPTIDRMIGHYIDLIDRLVKDPLEPHSGISLLSADRYEKIVREWNRTDREYPTGTTVHQLFSEQAERTPDAVALVYGEARMSYRELNERSNSLARHIRQVFMDRTGHEMQPDTMVPLCLERSLEMVVGILGVLKAGAAYVPMDPGYPKERLLHILKDTGAELVLSQTRMEERENLSPIEEIGLNIDLSEPFYQKYQGKELQPNSGPEDLAYVIYTSGTTGKPKGVMVQHGGIVNMVYIQEHRLKINEGSKIVQYASYVFDASVWEIFGSLSIGAELSIIPDSIRQDAALLSEHIEKHGINTALFPPILLMEMSFVKLKALKTLLVGGDASSLKLMDTWHVGRMLVNAYGPTEGTVCASMYRYGKGDLNTKIGKPLSNTRAYVLDPYGSPVPIGVPGELYIGGAGLARGYLNQPGLTAERFVANTFATEKDMAKGYDRLYRTGDMVRWLADGNLEFLGRNDHQVKIRGYRIELGEVEHAISRIEGIKQACVLALERETGSGTVKYLVGYYVLEENFAMEQTVLSERLSGILPEYMVPSALVNMESFPLTVNGKLDRRALPSPELGSSGNDYVPPSTDLQEQLCHIWEEVLGLERVGITDDFFRIGGNSILAIRVSHQMERAMNKKVNVADIFKLKSIQIILQDISLIVSTSENIEKEF